MKHVKRGNKRKVLLNKDTLFPTTRPLEMLHMDLFGPSRTMSIGGNYYVFGNQG